MSETGYIDRKRGRVGEKGRERGRERIKRRGISGLAYHFSDGLITSKVIPKTPGCGMGSSFD